MSPFSTRKRWRILNTRNYHQWREPQIYICIITLSSITLLFSLNLPPIPNVSFALSCKWYSRWWLEPFWRVIAFQCISHVYWRYLLLFNHYVMSDSFAAPWIFSCQALLSMGFSRQEYWSGLPFPPPGDLPNPGIKPMSPALAGRFFTTELPPRKPILEVHMLLNSVFLLLIFLLLQSGFRQVPRRVGEISSPILGRNTCIISIHSLKNILHLREKKKHRKLCQWNKFGSACPDAQ